MTARHRRFTRLLVALGVVVVAGGAYLSYELGRFQAGYSLLDERRRLAEFELAIAEREATIEQLERQQAILETSREIDRETYARLESELERLQERVQAQEEELAFYRGIVKPSDGVSGLKIQTLEISPTDAERHYRLRLTLVQAVAHNDRVSGSVRLSVAGSTEGEARELSYPEIAAGEAALPLEYEFRYFQTLERELLLPVGFEPDTVTVEVRQTEPGADDALTQRFGWDSIGG